MIPKKAAYLTEKATSYYSRCMADAPKHSYIWDAVGLIVLYAGAMVLISVPILRMRQTPAEHPLPQVEAHDVK